MSFKNKTLRTFIGAKDYEISQSFYRELGYEEIIISETMSLYRIGSKMEFYLQKYYVKEWVDNTMMFVEIDDVEACYESLKSKMLPKKYKGVKLTEIKTLDWGRECFLHDPSGVLWHFGEFN